MSFATLPIAVRNAVTVSAISALTMIAVAIHELAAQSVMGYITTML